MPTSIAFGLFTNETYFLNDAQVWQPLAQYVHAIMQQGIVCNFVDVVNQLFFAYRSLTPKLYVFVSPLTKSTKATDFIYALEEKQQVWHKMMTTSVKPQRYYNPMQKTSPYRPLLASQAKAFSCY